MTVMPRLTRCCPGRQEARHGGGRPRARGGESRDRRVQDRGAGGGAQGGRQQPQVPRGLGGEGKLK